MNDDNEELKNLSQAYLHLLSIPFNSTFRIHNQKFYASIRDQIAYLSDANPEYVQTSFEGVVAISTKTY